MNTIPGTLFTTSLIDIKDKSVLLVFNIRKQVWHLPGGEIDEGESPEVALARIIREQLNCQIDPFFLSWYMHVSAAESGRSGGLPMEQDCFFYHQEIYPRAKAKMSAIRYFSVEEYKKEKNPVMGILTVMEQLKEDELL